MSQDNAQEIDSQSIFTSLMENALDFLTVAIKNFESDDLQQSLINFNSGVELVLKSRLLMEHWTLIVIDPRSANPANFMKGDFQSVGSDEAIIRLRRIVRLSIPDTTQIAFERVRIHRNKMNHFYHPEFISGNIKVKEEIAGVELNAWGHLYVLVAKIWFNEFHDFVDRFNEIDTAMLRHKEFLKGKFEGLKAQIDKEITEGIPYKQCSLCGYPSSRLEEDVYPVFNGFCQVCIGWMRFLDVTCAHCSTVNYYDMNDDEKACGGCDKTFDMDALLELHGHGGTGAAYCEECDYLYSGYTVVMNDSRDIPRYICLSCYEVFDDVDQCQLCDSNLAGNHPDTQSIGCFKCRDALEAKRASE